MPEKNGIRPRAVIVQKLDPDTFNHLGVGRPEMRHLAAGFHETEGGVERGPPDLPLVVKATAVARVITAPKITGSKFTGLIGFGMQRLRFAPVDGCHRIRSEVVFGGIDARRQGEPVFGLVRRLVNGWISR